MSRAGHARQGSGAGRQEGAVVSAALRRRHGVSGADQGGTGAAAVLDGALSELVIRGLKRGAGFRAGMYFTLNRLSAGSFASP
jgi:hypothetical protein